MIYKRTQRLSLKIIMDLYVCGITTASKILSDIKKKEDKKIVFVEHFYKYYGLELD